jgi:hypothetical protein
MAPRINEQTKERKKETLDNQTLEKQNPKQTNPFNKLSHKLTLDCCWLSFLNSSTPITLPWTQLPHSNTHKKNFSSPSQPQP